MPKREFIEKMFDDIAPSYDKLDHILSVGIDKNWRRKAAKMICQSKPSKVLDIACGTGDSLVALAKSGIKDLTGIDISKKMLGVAEKKLKRKHIDVKIFHEDCASMSFEDETFDAVTTFFGMRNFEDKLQCLAEIRRVLKPGGTLAVIELSEPRNKAVKSVYRLYFQHFTPWVGGKVSGKRNAYRYLPGSVAHFPQPAEFMGILHDAGFTNIKHKPLSFGICRIFICKK